MNHSTQIMCSNDFPFECNKIMVTNKRLLSTYICMYTVVCYIHMYTQVNTNRDNIQNRIYIKYCTCKNLLITLYNARLFIGPTHFPER